MLFYQNYKNTQNCTHKILKWLIRVISMKEIFHNIRNNYTDRIIVLTGNNLDTDMKKLRLQCCKRDV